MGSDFTPYRPTPRGLAGWLLLLLIGIALDGAVGIAPALIVAFIRAGKLPTRSIGAAGVIAVALAVPVALISTEGGDAGVHQDFVTDSMLAHHLTFIGLVLVFVGVYFDRAERPATAPDHRPGAGEAAEVAVDGEPAGDRPLALRRAVIAVVAAAAVIVVLAVQSV